MVKFFFTYLIVGGLLAAGIWYAIPTAKHKVYERLYQPVQDFSSTEYILRPTTPVEKKTITFAVAPSRTTAKTHETDNDGDSDTASSTETTVATTGRQTIGRSTTLATTPPVPFTPSWGVIRDTTNSFTATGVLFEKLKGGTVVDRISRHDSDAGAMIKSRVLKDGQWISDIFVPEKSIVAFEGRPSTVSVEERDAILKYFVLRNQIAERRATFRETAIRANPHFEAYRAAAMAMIDLQRKAQELTAKRDISSGSERNRLNEELRRIKYEEPKLNNILLQAEVPYKEWRAKNDDGTKAIDSDAQLKEWVAALDKMEADVRAKAIGNSW